MTQTFSIKDLYKINNATTREAWIRNELSQIPAGLVVLDAGCGTQPYRKYCSHLKYYAQDFAAYDGRGDKCGLQSESFSYGRLDYTSDIWNIPERDGFCDVVICTEVIEHIPYPNETIAELGRLLKPGGVLLLTAPYCSIPHMTPFYFFNGFSSDYYKFFLSKYGLELEYIGRNGDPFLYLAQELRRVGSILPKSSISHWILTGVTILSIPWMKLLSKWFGQSLSFDYLHFGYHIRGRKI